MAADAPGETGLIRVDIPVVTLPEGEVLLAPLERLRHVVSVLRSDVSDLEKQNQALQAQVDGKYRDMGAELVRQRSQWDTAATDAPTLSAAVSLLAQQDTDEQNIRAMKSRPHGFLPDPLGGLKQMRLEHDRARTETELAPLLVVIAKQAPSTTVDSAESIRRDAKELEVRAAEQTEQITQRKQWISQITEEIARREKVTAQMGFDLLYESARLAKFGLESISSPLVMKPGENAYLVIDATLAKNRKRTYYQGRSSGWSFPVVGGVRYRVGSFRGQPISQEYISEVEGGSLVLTNQRVAFASSQHGVSIPLGKLLHVEVYTDGLAFVKEGKESADLFFVRESRRFLFHLNYVLDHRPDPPSSRQRRVLIDPALKKEPNSPD